VEKQKKAEGLKKKCGEKNGHEQPSALAGTGGLAGNKGGEERTCRPIICEAAGIGRQSQSQRIWGAHYSDKKKKKWKLGEKRTARYGRGKKEEKELGRGPTKSLESLGEKGTQEPKGGCCSRRAKKPCGIEQKTKNNQKLLKRNRKNKKGETYPGTDVEGGKQIP